MGLFPMVLSPENRIAEVYPNLDYAMCQSLVSVEKSKPANGTHINIFQWRLGITHIGCH